MFNLRYIFLAAYMTVRARSFCSSLTVCCVITGVVGGVSVDRGATHACEIGAPTSGMYVFFIHFYLVDLFYIDLSQPLNFSQCAIGSQRQMQMGRKRTFAKVHSGLLMCIHVFSFECYIYTQEIIFNLLLCS